MTKRSSKRGNANSVSQEGLAVALAQHRPAHISSVGTVARRYEEFGHAEQLNITLNNGIVIQHILQSNSDAEDAFKALAEYISSIHPTILPTWFSIRFLDVFYTKQHLIDVLKNLTLPKKAPEKWPGKWHSAEALPDFFRRVWGRYLIAGLTTAHLRELDEKLFNAIHVHRHRRLPWPDDLELPNERTALKRAMEEFAKGNINALSPEELVAVARKRKRDAEARKRIDAQGRLSRSKRRRGMELDR